jgi:hypothetical protein
MPPEHLLVRLEWAGERSRGMTFEARGTRYQELLGSLAARLEKRR